VKFNDVYYVKSGLLFRSQSSVCKMTDHLSTLRLEFDYRQEQSFISSLPISDRLWGTLICSRVGIEGFSPWAKNPGTKLTSHFHVVPRTKMYSALHLQLYVLS
jgi:hypothetical protein